jgi:hypothetical protein
VTQVRSDKCRAPSVGKVGDFRLDNVTPGQFITVAFLDRREFERLERHFAAVKLRADLFFVLVRIMRAVPKAKGVLREYR